MKNLIKNLVLFLMMSVLFCESAYANTFIKDGSLVQGVTSTASSAGTLNLSASSTTNQRITGTTTHTVVLPNATTLSNGRRFEISNASTGNVTVNYFGGSLAKVVSPGTDATFVVYDNTTSAGVFDTKTGGATPVDFASVGSNVLPTTDNTYVVGNSSKRWSDVASVTLNLYESGNTGNNLQLLPNSTDYIRVQMRGTMNNFWIQSIDDNSGPILHLVTPTSANDWTFQVPGTAIPAETGNLLIGGDANKDVKFALTNKVVVLDRLRVGSTTGGQSKNVIQTGNANIQLYTGPAGDAATTISAMEVVDASNAWGWYASSLDSGAGFWRFNGTNRIKIQADGDVALGNQDPQSRLHLYEGSAVEYGIQVGNSVSGNGAGAGINMLIGSGGRFIFRNSSNQIYEWQTGGANTRGSLDSAGSWFGTTFKGGDNNVSHSFENHTGHGMGYHSTLDEVAFYTNTTKRGGITDTYWYVNNPIRGPNGAVGAPTYSFTNSTNAGMYSSVANYLFFATNGVVRLAVNDGGGVFTRTGGDFGTYNSTDSATTFYITNTAGANEGRVQLQSSTSRIENGSGTVSAPGYAFFGDADTGYWRSAAGSFAWSSNGVNVGSYTESGGTWLFRPIAVGGNQATFEINPASDPSGNGTQLNIVNGSQTYRWLLRGSGFGDEQGALGLYNNTDGHYTYVINRYKGFRVGQTGSFQNYPAFSVQPNGDTTSIGGTATASGTTVTGSGTKFRYHLAVGDRISLDAGTNFATIIAIASDTSLTTDVGLTGTAQPIYRRLSPFRLDDRNGNHLVFVNDLGRMTIGGAGDLTYPANDGKLYINHAMGTTSEVGVRLVFTSPGSANVFHTGVQMTIGNGYNGNQRVGGYTVTNNGASTGSRPLTAQGNYGFSGSIQGSTTGGNFGAYLDVSNADFNAAFYGSAVTNKNNAGNIGVIGVAKNTGTNGKAIAGYFRLSDNDTITAYSHLPTTQAAIYGSNDTSSHPIMLLQDNNTTVFQVLDGGAIAHGTSMGNSGITAGWSTTGTSGVIIGDHGSNVYSLRWNDGATLWGLRANAATQAGIVEFFNTNQGTTITANTTTGQLLTADGSAAAPAYSFRNAGGSDNGMYLSATDQVSFATAGTERLRITATGRLQGINGDVTNVGIGFIADPNTGLMNDGADELDFVTGGVVRAYFSTTDLNIRTSLNMTTVGGNHVIKNNDGTVGAPSYTFRTGTTSGLYYNGSVNVAVGGVDKAEFNANYIQLYDDVAFSPDNTYDVGFSDSSFRPRYVRAGTSFRGPNGTVSAPSFTFGNFDNYGMWAASGQLSFSVAGAENLRLSNTADVILQGFTGSAGQLSFGPIATAGKPYQSLKAGQTTQLLVHAPDNTTGKIFLWTGSSGQTGVVLDKGAEEIQFSTGGTQRGKFNSTGDFFVDSGGGVNTQIGTQYVNVNGSGGGNSFMYYETGGSGYKDGEIGFSDAGSGHQHYLGYDDGDGGIGVYKYSGSEIPVAKFTSESGNVGRIAVAGSGGAFNSYIEAISTSSMKIVSGGSTGYAYSAGTSLNYLWYDDGTYKEVSMFSSRVDTPESVNLTADNQVVNTRRASFIKLTSDDATAANRTFTLNAPASEGANLVLVWTDATDAGELLDTGNAKLNGDWTPNVDDSIKLIYSGSSWVEVSRSAN